MSFLEFEKELVKGFFIKWYKRLITWNKKLLLEHKTTSYIFKYIKRQKNKHATVSYKKIVIKKKL